jgi:hypothetical protein
MTLRPPYVSAQMPKFSRNTEPERIATAISLELSVGESQLLSDGNAQNTQHEPDAKHQRQRTRRQQQDPFLLSVIPCSDSRDDSLHVQHNVSICFFDVMNVKAFMRFAARSGLQVKLVSVQRTNHSSTTDDAFRQRPLTVGTAVLTGEDAAITLPENRDLISTDDVTPSLPHRDRSGSAKVDAS